MAKLPAHISSIASIFMALSSISIFPLIQNIRQNVRRRRV